jgi:hypothetical protein
LSTYFFPHLGIVFGDTNYLSPILGQLSGNNSLSGGRQVTLGHSSGMDVIPRPRIRLSYTKLIHIGISFGRLSDSGTARGEKQHRRKSRTNSLCLYLSPSLRGVPGRGSSSRPFSPRSNKRLRHLPTGCAEVANCRAMAVLLCPADTRGRELVAEDGTGACARAS